MSADIKLYMSNQTRFGGSLGKKIARVFGPLAIIMFFLPTVAFANETINFTTDRTDYHQFSVAATVDARGRVFTPSGNADTVEVNLQLLKISGSGGNVVISVNTTSAGVPTDTVLGSITVSYDSLANPNGGSPYCNTPATNYGSITGLSLVSGTAYALVVKNGTATGSDAVCGGGGGTNEYVRNTTWSGSPSSDDFFGFLNLSATAPLVASSSSPFAIIFGTSTLQLASSTLSIVDNPTQDFFMGMVLFLSTMFGVMFWFKRR